MSEQAGIALVTDSASMLPPALRDRYGVVVVPITITIDGHDFAEGVDLDPVEFYDRLAGGANVTTAAPSPGAFVEVYRAVTAGGADAVVSIHTGAAYSATVAAATVAAGLVDTPVTIVDTGVASFPVGLAVWAAADAVRAGRSADDVAAEAAATAAEVGSLFVVGVPEVARRGGRLVGLDGALTPTTVLELAGGSLAELGRVDDLDAAIDLMAEATVRAAADRPVRVGVGHALRRAAADELAARLTGRLGVAEVTIYEVGPSVGAHTGVGTFGVVHAPVR